MQDPAIDEVSPTPAEAVAALASQLTRGLSAEISEDAEGDKPSPLFRAEVRIGQCLPLPWLRAQRDTTQYYWSDRDDAFEMAGIGEADVLVPLGPTDLAGLFRHMSERLSPRFPSLRYYGGFRFHPGAVKGERWKAFREYRFVVPRFEILRKGAKVYFVCNAKLGHPRTNARTLESILEDLARIQFPESFPPMRVPPIRSRGDAPDRDAWCALVSRTLGAIGRDEFEKVVLARETTFTAGEALDPVGLLGLLQTNTMRSFEFCFHPAPGRAFIGASPERLYKRVNLFVQSEALAGTRPRGRTDKMDRLLGEDLMNSDKERREHDVVVRALAQQLKERCRHLVIEESPSLLQLRNIQHLRTRVEGLLKEDQNDASLLEALHPTPAVGGSPRDRALAWIAREEPFDRGIFAAPVGWVSYDASEFCVGIRSGLVQGNELVLYNGSGIVRGSNPDDEWDELENKMENFLQVLDHDA